MNRKVRRSVTDMLKQIVRKIGPDILIVSGDLANQPVPWQMKKAARVVREIEQECAQAHPLLRTIVLPGNHDFKFFGNVGLFRLTRIPFEIYFRRRGLDHSFGWRCLEAWKLRFKALWWKNQEMREPLIFDKFDDRPELGFAIFVLNSNTLAEMMAAGKVESTDLQQLYRKIDENAGVPEFPFLYKIAVVHHHPAPIADAPSDALARLEDSFMIFYNAGLFLQELSRRGFNLVLHGHKHVAGFLRISCELPDLGRTELAVAAAGSACHPRPDDSRGNHLQFIELFDDDTARLTSWFFSADVEKKQPETRCYPLDTLADVRRRRYAVFRARQKYSCRQVTKTMEITSDGYTRVQIDFDGCTVFGEQGLDSIPLSLTTGRPGYIRGVATSTGSSQFEEITPAAGSSIYDYKAAIDLPHRHTAQSGTFRFGYLYRLMNGHTLTAEEFARHYAGTENTSEYATITCDGAYDQLVLHVKFPPKYALTSLEFQAIAEYIPAPLRGIEDARLDRGEATQHDEETNRIRGYLKTGDNEVIFTCPEPVPGLIYKICWKFRPLSGPSPQDLSSAAVIAAAKDRLLAIANTAKSGGAGLEDWNRARRILNELVSDINRNVAPDTKEDLRVNIMVFDEKTQRLRFVCANTDPADLPALDFISGEGCAGFAFEKTRYLLYHPKRDPLGYFIRSNEWPTPGRASDPIVLASFPWIHNPADDQRRLVVGVVNLSSHISTTKLLGLFSLGTAEQEAKMKTLQDLVNLSASRLITI